MEIGGKKEAILTTNKYGQNYVPSRYTVPFSSTYGDRRSVVLQLTRAHCNKLGTKATAKFITENTAALKTFVKQAGSSYHPYEYIGDIAKREWLGEIALLPRRY